MNLISWCFGANQKRLCHLLDALLIDTSVCSGGYLAVTDANLVLGRLLPKYFPHIFGETEDQPLDAESTKHAFELLTAEVRISANLLVSLCILMWQTNDKHICWSDQFLGFMPCLCHCSRHIFSYYFHAFLVVFF